MEKNIELGIQNGWVSNHKYHSGPGWSTSNIKLLAEKSPKHMIYAKENPSPPTDAMAVGTAFHTLTLEPEHFNRRFATIPDVDAKAMKDGNLEIVTDGTGKRLNRSSNIGKAWFGKQERLEKTIISPEKVDDVMLMVNAVKEHKSAGALLQRLPGTTYERAVYYEDDQTGLLCKVRPDIITDHPGLHIITDLKKCQDASYRGFQKAIGNYRYDLQAFKYLFGCNMATGKVKTFDEFVEMLNLPADELAELDIFAKFIFMCCEDVAPYAVQCHEADQDMLINGSELYRWGVDRIADCTKKNKWPGYPETVNPISLPPWMLT